MRETVFWAVLGAAMTIPPFCVGGLTGYKVATKPNYTLGDKPAVGELRLPTIYEAEAIHHAYRNKQAIERLDEEIGRLQEQINKLTPPKPQGELMAGK